MKYCEGDKVYVIVSNRWIKPGRVVKRDRDFLTVSLFERGDTSAKGKLVL